MTAPAHRPTPADLARPKPKHPAPKPKPTTPAPAPAAMPTRPTSVDHMVTAADAVRPGRLRKGEAFRTMFEQGIRISGLNPNTRLTALTLLGYANFRNGEIHTRWRPNSGQLAIASGLTADQVDAQLRILTSRGWLHEFALTHGPRTGELCWQLGVPAAVLQQLRDRMARAAETAEITR